MGKIDPIAGNDLLQALNVALQGQFQSRFYRDTNFGNNNQGWFITEKDGKFLVRNLSGAVATFSLEELPGCCGVIVSYYSEVELAYRKLGLGELLLKVRMDACRVMKYGQMLATVVAGNQAEEKLLDCQGWLKVKEFRNPKTQNIVQTYLVNL